MLISLLGHSLVGAHQKFRSHGPRVLKLVPVDGQGHIRQVTAQLIKDIAVWPRVGQHGANIVEELLLKGGTKHAGRGIQAANDSGMDLRCIHLHGSFRDSRDIDRLGQRNTKGTRRLVN